MSAADSPARPDTASRVASLAGQAVPASAPASPQKRNPLRLWPGILIVALEWLIILAPSMFEPSMLGFMAMMFAPMIGVGALLLWWLLFSGLRWSDRFLGAGVFIASGALAIAVNQNQQTFPMMAVMFYALPALTAAWVAWLTLSIPLAWRARFTGLLLVFIAGWGLTMMLRMDGTTGAFKTTFNWRWTPTVEDKFRAEQAAMKSSLTPVLATKQVAKEPVTLGPGDWPGFRGPQRDGRLSGVKIAANFNDKPPKQIWRHRVGPGWGSFAVVGGRLYTQEQRGDSGEQEAVVCYSADTGEVLWTHTDSARFSEALAGPGPRATPTFDSGRIYSLGANGALNCLDAATGNLVWQQDIAKDSGAKLPMWGFSASPLVADGVVTVFAGGPGGKSVLGYQADDGKLAWSAGDGLLSYSSTQLSKLGGVEQLLIASDTGVAALEPASGKLLWEHRWPVQGMARIVQPAVLDDSSLLVGTGFDFGTRKLDVNRDGDKWTVTEAWTSRDIKPYYNDLVVYNGYIYGFDNSIFTCVSLKDGKRQWKYRGYGNGQALLLTDQGTLLVIAETGELVMVEASPKGYKELCRFPALEGKTWNHPVVAHGRVYLRNGEEAACYELTPADGA